MPEICMMASDASCGESMTRFARRVPAACGRKKITMWHESPAGIVEPTWQLLS